MRTRRWAEAQQRLADDQALRHSTPSAVVLQVVDNGPDHGWKYLVWDYDPDQSRLLAGGVEGIVVPHAIVDGFENMAQARTVGLAAIRKSGWMGDVVLREPVE